MKGFFSSVSSVTAGTVSARQGQPGQASYALLAMRHLHKLSPAPDRPRLHPLKPRHCQPPEAPHPEPGSFAGSMLPDAARPASPRPVMSAHPGQLVPNSPACSFSIVSAYCAAMLRWGHAPCPWPLLGAAPPLYETVGQSNATQPDGVPHQDSRPFTLDTRQRHLHPRPRPVPPSPQGACTSLLPTLLFLQNLSTGLARVPLALT